MMKFHLLKYLAGVIILMYAASCERLLDVDVKSDITDQTYWRNEGDFTNYLVGMYSQYRSLMNEQAFGEDRSELYVQGYLPRFSAYWSQVITAENTRDWLNFYSFVGHANLLLSKAEGFSFSNQQTYRRVRAEALTLRAMMYFYLCRIYGDVPLVLDPVIDEKVPLLPRTPVKEVFVQINRDIEEALELFPQGTQADVYFASARVAHALRADVAVWEGKVLAGGNASFEKALTSIAGIRQSGVSLQANFRDITVKKNPEIIFSLYFNRSEALMYASYAYPFIQYVGNSDNVDELPVASSSSYGQAAYVLSPQAVALFKYPEDKRIPATYVAELINGEIKYYWPNKYRGTVQSDSRVADDDMICYRWADMLLLEAEAYAALGRLEPALSSLNEVRERAGIPEFESKDRAAIEKEILDERGRELVHENKRWWDLVRAHHHGTIDVYKVVPNLAGKNVPFYWPIHTRTMSLNPLLEQTPGY